jgi:anaerobic nitric oxide reductase transcription regulator
MTAAASRGGNDPRPTGSRLHPTASVGQLDAIVSFASHLTAARSSEERYRRLLAAVREVIPYDAATLLRLDGAALVPLVTDGLSQDAMGRRFRIEEHPRLGVICRSETPVRFPDDSELPDPFDGLLAIGQGSFRREHACLGFPLRVGGKLIGALTADAAQPSAFDPIDPDFLAALGALAAAEMQTTQRIESLERSAERQDLIARDLMRDAQLRHGAELIGTTTTMQRLRRDIGLVARSDFPVLITGETGVGKELVARAVHAASERRSEPMLYVDCAALPEALADSELFGKLELASGGTLLLDQIGGLSSSTQSRLLRAIQQGEIQRVGSDELIRIDVRLIVATNRDLDQEVEAGRFRADLSHRLRVHPLHVPPLRERTDDIPVLAAHFCDVTRRRLGLGPVGLEPSALAALKSYPWPGNVRELDNVLWRATLRAAGRGRPIVLTTAELGSDFGGAPSANPGQTAAGDAPANVELKEATREFQRSLIRRALVASGGNWAAAARSLGMHRSNFHHLAARLGLKQRS